MILSHKNDEQFQGALKDLVRNHFWNECMQSQCIADLAEGLSKHWHTKCFLWSGLVCPDVAIICSGEGEGVRRREHLVVQFLILYLSCNLSSHSDPNEHTSGTQDNHSVEAIFYQWDFHSSRPWTFLAAIISNYCLDFEIWTIQNEESLAILLKGTLLTRTHCKWKLIVLRMSVCAGFKSKSFFNLSNKQAEFRLPCIHRLLKMSSRIGTVCSKIHLKSLNSWLIPRNGKRNQHSTTSNHNFRSNFLLKILRL